MTDPALVAFVAESNRIEGIRRPPADVEVAVLELFVGLEMPFEGDLLELVEAFQPDAVLRARSGLDVYVGNHRPPPGGPQILTALDEILSRAWDGTPPYLIHLEYETLHPFTDGNGRSGRALWLWGMRQLSEQEYDRTLALGFLHSWYYQSLEFSRVRA